MKVCFIVGTLDRGGAEKQLVFMLRALKRAGVAAKVLCLTRGEFYERELRQMGIETEFVGDSGNQFRRLWEIIRILRRERPEIVQSSHFYTNLYAALAGKLLSIPSIGAVRSDLSYEMNSHRLSGRWQIRLPDFLIVNSRAGYDRLIKSSIPAEKIEFVKNACPVETEKLSKPPREKELLNILFAGRLDENKRPEIFIRLAARLVSEMPEAPLNFQVAGDGVLRARLENQAASLGLSPDRMLFLGSCERMSKIYEDADILVSTSAREGTPNVILEALAHGLAVVATDAGGTKEILGENRGIVVEKNDDEDLFRRVCNLLADHDLRRRLGLNGQNYVFENYSLEALEMHLLRIYARLTGRPEVSASCALNPGKII